MARAWFGGTSDDWMMGTVAAFGATLVTLNALPVTGTCWNAQTGGNQITDLLDANGAAITVLTVTGSQLPRFQGPDGVVEIWVDFGAGRTLLQARDQAAAAAAAATDSQTARDEAQTYAGDAEAAKTTIVGLSGTYAQHSRMGASSGSGNLTLGQHRVDVTDGVSYDAFPGLAQLSDGTLVGIFRRAAQHNPYAGSTPATPPAYKGVLYVTRSTDRGATWSAPVAAYEDAVDDSRDPALTLLGDGRLAAVFFLHDGLIHVSVQLMISDDGGLTWAAPTRIPFTFTAEAACSGPLVELAADQWLVAAYGANTGDPAGAYTVRTIRTLDGGTTWQDETTLAAGTSTLSYQEPNVGRLADGSIMCLIRQGAGTPTIWRSASTDGGVTWTSPVSVVVGNGRPAWVQMASGGVVLVTRDPTGSNLPAIMTTSWDKGLTWAAPVTVSPWYEYAQMVQTAPGVTALLCSQQNSATSATPYLVYLLDGNGLSPLDDVSVGQLNLQLTATDVGALGAGAIRVNRYPRPNGIAAGTTGYSAFGTGTVLSVETGVVHATTRSLKVATPGAAGSEGVALSTTYGATGGTNPETHSVWVKAPAGATMIARFRERTTAGALVGDIYTSAFTATGDWQRVGGTGTRTNAANVIVPQVTTNLTTQAVTFYLAEILGEAGTALRDYFDGSNPGSALTYALWLGTVEAAPSMRIATS